MLDSPTGQHSSSTGGPGQHLTANPIQNNIQMFNSSLPASNQYSNM